MTSLEPVIKLSNLMSQAAKNKMGLMPAPEEKDIRNALNEYFRAKNLDPIEFETLPEMMSFVSDIVYKEIYVKR